MVIFIQYLVAVQSRLHPLWPRSLFNPSYQIYQYFSTWGARYLTATASVAGMGCTQMQLWYIAVSYWNTGNPNVGCQLTGQALSYMRAVLQHHKLLFGFDWPYVAP